MPQLERLREQRLGGVIALRPRLSDQGSEPVQIHRHQVEVQDVPSRPTIQPDTARRQAGSQSRNIAVKHFSSALGRTVAPHPIDEEIDRHGAAGVHQQRCQHAALPRGPNVERPAVQAYLNVTEQSEHDRCVYSALVGRFLIHGSLPRNVPHRESRRHRRLS